jgi:hypothetical protein
MGISRASPPEAEDSCRVRLQTINRERAALKRRVRTIHKVRIRARLLGAPKSIHPNQQYRRIRSANPPAVTPEPSRHPPQCHPAQSIDLVFTPKPCHSDTRAQQAKEESAVRIIRKEKCVIPRPPIWDRPHCFLTYDTASSIIRGYVDSSQEASHARHKRGSPGEG